LEDTQTIHAFFDDIIISPLTRESDKNGAPKAEGIGQYQASQ
jgi:hypothetical protein